MFLGLFFASFCAMLRFARRYVLRGLNMNATVDRKEERKVIAPGITMDKEKIYFGPETNIGKYGEATLLISDIDKALRETYEEFYLKKKNK